MINRAQKYFFNALLLSASSIALRGISVAFNAYISERLGAEGMGLLTLMGGIFGFTITLACSGINLAVVRLVSASVAKGDGRARRIMRASFFYSLVFSITSAVLLFLLSRAIGDVLLRDARVVLPLRVFAISLPAISLSSAISGYFYAVRRVYKGVIAQFVEQGVRVTLCSYLLVIVAGGSLEVSCVAFVLGGVISEIVSAIVSGALYLIDRKRLFRVEATHNSELGRICSVALPVAISAYVRSALSTIEHLAIPWGLRRCGLGYEASLSSYGVLHGMVIPLLLFPSAMLSAFSSLLVPELSEAHACQNTTRVRYIVSRAFALSLLFSIGISGAFVSFSHEIGEFLYGSAEAGEYIRLLSPLIPLMYLDGAVDAMLKGLGEQLYTMRVNISDSLISVLLIILLLPRFGIRGYVAVIFITEVFNTSFSIIKLLNISGVSTPVIKWVFKPLASIAVSTLIARALFDSGVMLQLFGIVESGKSYLILELAITMLLYLIVSRIMGVITKDDVRWGKRLVSQK